MNATVEIGGIDNSIFRLASDRVVTKKATKREVSLNVGAMGAEVER